MLLKRGRLIMIFFAAILTLLCLLVNCSTASKHSSSMQAAAAAASSASYGHQVAIVNITDFLSDLSRRLQFVIGAYQSNRINKTILKTIQSSSFVIAGTKPPVTINDDIASQSYQAVLYVVAVLLCYAAAICAMVVFNFKERRSQAKYEAYEDVIKKPRNYLYHYFREKYKDPSAVTTPRKKSPTSQASIDASSTNAAPNSSKAPVSQKTSCSNSQLLLSPTTESRNFPPLHYKISICSTETTATNGSSPTTPISYSAEASAVSPSGNFRRKTTPVNLAPLKDNIILSLSPTVEETCEADDTYLDVEHTASSRRSHFALRRNTDYSFGGDSGQMMQERPSPYLVIDQHLEESISKESFTSSVGGAADTDVAHETTPIRSFQHVKLCPTSSDISSFGSAATPMRGSLHSLGGVSFDDS